MRLKGRSRRHKRITKKLKGDTQRPRLVVFRSQKHIYVQLVNDTEHKVLMGCSTLTKEFKGKKTTDQAAAREVGKRIAEHALKQGITKVCFDRAGFKYHGRIKNLAEGAREGGLAF